ncbi:putative vps5 C terminal like [Lyophyllum shimeji]|uniref:Vps5 C terminal like n=1 Tax=Lyophyllum shimeji TaxID=47721 RepID=A0A9P3US14_LYOSH|nr:putative vps5 C terminal like [Lyophyllum shimeji]
MASSTSFQAWDSQQVNQQRGEFPAYVSTSKLEAALNRASEKALKYEYQIKELEVRLSESLSNFRAIDSLVQEAYGNLQRNTRRAERACQTQVPHINSELDESVKVLSDLADTLPTIQSQLAEVRVVYDSGREKAQTLVSELRWLNTEFYERWRRIIFTNSSPVSWRWKAIMRILFAFSFIICINLFWLLVLGAYRAHRHSFDDLLAPSRSVLEDNPFADPFAKRSGSPDPWATPFAHSSADVFGHDTTPTADSFSTAANPYDTSSTASAETPVHESSKSPLEITEEHQDSHEPAQTQSPGFRESIPAAFSEIATIRPTQPEEIQPPLVPSDETPRSATPVYTQAPPESPSSLSERGKETPRAGSPVVSPSVSSSASKSSNEVLSPVGRGAPLGIDGSMAGLSLGADALGGGWQSEQGAWGGAPQPDDDSDDDKPIGQTMKSSRKSSAENKLPPDVPPLKRHDSGLQPVFVITVDDPQKVGDPIRGYTMYTVHTRTTSPLFKKSAFSVLRRYSDFLWLYETLSANNPGVVVPPVPEKNPFGRFDDHFVRQRRFALEKCIQKVANHPVLGKDPDLRLFLESDTFALDIKHRKAEIAHERGGMLASIGQTIAGPRFYETDEWFDKQKAYLDSLESQLRGLVKAIEAVARQRTELATSSNEFAQSVSELSASDVGKQLSHGLAGLADVERKAHDLQAAQAEQDMVTLMGTVDEYARLINSVRLAFSSRVRTYHAWKSAESELLRTKQNHEKNRAQGRIPTDRLGYSLSQIAEAERRALDAKHEFDQVSKLVKSEVARFEQERIEDFKDSLHAFLEGMISKQKELIAAWENYQQMLLKRVGGGGTVPNMPKVTA